MPKSAAPSTEPDPFIERTGARIRVARMRSKRTQAQVASLLGWSASEVAMLETGRANLTINKLRKFGALFGIRPSWFIDEEAEELPQAKPPEALDPNYVFDQEEKFILERYRELSGKERRIVKLLMSEIPTCRDHRYDPAARKLRFRWTNPHAAPKDPLSFKVTPAMGLWLKENAAKYHGMWICMKMGKFQTAAPTRADLIAKMVGVRDCVLISLLDLERPKFERWSWTVTPQPLPAPAPSVG